MTEGARGARASRGTHAVNGRTRKPGGRLGIVHGALVLFAVLLVGRSAMVQLVQHDVWLGRAERQQLRADTLPAPRGAILDANGEVLAESQEQVAIAVAPREVRSPNTLRTLLREAGVPAAVVGRALDTSRAWVEIPQRLLPMDAAPIVALKGVHATPSVRRVSPAAEGIRRIVGQTDKDGVAIDGVELALDSVLRGERGRTRVLRDAGGRSFESPAVRGEEPTPGSTVVLTLDHALQDIAEHELEQTVASTGASGGDIVVLDPRSGALLALASRREGRGLSGVPAFTETYEPGSTIKPFLAARLLDAGLTRPDEVIATYDGTYMSKGRRNPIRDVRRASAMTVADIIRYSSNVGIVRLAERMTPAEQYQALRDFGFGVPTGVAYPSEASGMLPHPRRWSLPTQAALAMGYEVGVTPLQLATAYAAIANGGELLEPALVKEIRTPDGTVTYRHERRVVRRVLSPEMARTMRGLLAAVVDSGTATDATLTTYEVGGKSGTARLNTGRGYEGGAYTASFVALFPADEPQLVVLVKLDRPQGVYFGGATAGPVTRAVLEAALAASDAALDRGDLARRARQLAADRPARRDGRSPGAPRTLPAAVPATAPVTVAAAESLEVSPARVPEPPGRARFQLAAGPPEPRTAPTGPRTIPDVAGLSMREAVRVLHAAGFNVRLVGGLDGTSPAAGATAPAGAVVRLGARRAGAPRDGAPR